MYQNNNGGPTYYNIEIYKNLGKGMLVSILDTFEKNPCSRIASSGSESLEHYRKEIAARVMKIRRFWKEAHVKRKFKNINELIKETFYEEFAKKNVWNLVLNEKLNIPTNKRMFSITQMPPSSTKNSSKKGSMVLESKASTIKELPSSAAIPFTWDKDENVYQEDGNEEDEEYEDEEGDMIYENRPMLPLVVFEENFIEGTKNFYRKQWHQRSLN